MTGQARSISIGLFGLFIRASLFFLLTRSFNNRNFPKGIITDYWDRGNFIEPNDDYTLFYNTLFEAKLEYF